MGRDRNRRPAPWRDRAEYLMRAIGNYPDAGLVGRLPRRRGWPSACGMPTPATMRVVQIEPGPMPILTASAPASISALVPSAVATLPARMRTELESFLARSTASSTRWEWPCAVSDDQQVDAGIDQALGALEAVIADAGGGGDPQPALLVLGGVGIELRTSRCP